MNQSIPKSSKLRTWLQWLLGRHVDTRSPIRRIIEDGNLKPGDRLDEFGGILYLGNHVVATIPGEGLCHGERWDFEYLGPEYGPRASPTYSGYSLYRLRTSQEAEVCRSEAIAAAEIRKAETVSSLSIRAEELIRDRVIRPSEFDKAVREVLKDVEAVLRQGEQER